MRVQYDTDAVRWPDRYEYYRDAAASEVAPVAIQGRPGGRLRAALSSVQVGDFLVEAISYTADFEMEILRNERMIRAGDPGCYRMCLNITGAEVSEQAGNQACYGPRDIGLFSLSSPYRSIRPASRQAVRVVMVTFPRRLLPLDEAAVTPLLGTLLPRCLAGHSLFAQFLTYLADSTGPYPEAGGLAEALRQMTTALIGERLGAGSGLTPAACRLLYQEWVRVIIARQADDPELNPAKISRAANISESYLHRLFHDSDQTPMQLVKSTRLEHCHRDLQDPAQAGKLIGEIAVARGYQRPDQFARDFRRRFGITATQLRQPSPLQPPQTRRPA
jgi:AraC-like DNA-binding protein